MSGQHAEQRDAEERDDRQQTLPDAHLLWDHAGTVALAAVALVLIGFSQAVTA